jgi:hypothetical protein
MSKVLKPIFKSINMKNLILPALLFVSTSLFAVEPPKFLKDFIYQTEMVTSEDGETFECYIVSARNNEQFKSLNKVFQKMKHQETWVEDGVVYCARSGKDYAMVRGWAWGFRAFSVYEN